MPKPDRIAISSAARERPVASASRGRCARSGLLDRGRVEDRRDRGHHHRPTDVPRHVRDPGCLPHLILRTPRPSMPTTPARSPGRARPKARRAGGRGSRTSRTTRRAPTLRTRAAPRPKPATMASLVPMRAAIGVINGVTAIMAAAAGSVATPVFERAHPEGRRILEVETEDVHQAVERARDDQDRQGRPDEHLVAEQREIDDRGGDALLDDDEEHRADDGGDEASECGRRRPAPVAALAEPEDERNESDCDQDRAGVVDRAGPLRVARLLHLGERQRDARGRDRSVEPEQALPAAQVDERSADERAHGCPRRRGGAPDRDRPHLSLARGGDRQEAHPAGQDRRARSTLDQAPDDDPGAARRQRDQHARGDEEQRARRGRRACGRTRLRAPRRSRSRQRRRACSRSPPIAAARWERRRPRSSSAAGW